MRRSPEELRSFYLIAINKDSVPSDVADTEHGDLTPSTQFKGQRDSAAGTDFDSVRIIQTDSRAVPSRHKTFLGNAVLARKDFACQQCQLGTLQCDLQRPSCWKCQRYFLPCHYENDYEDDYELYGHIEDHIDREDEPPSWHESVKAHPYQSLEGKKTLRCVDKDKLPSAVRRARLSKPVPRDRRVRFDIQYNTKENEETLLGPSSPSVSEMDTASRTSSPISFDFDAILPATSTTTGRTNTTSQIISKLDAEAPLPLCPAIAHIDEVSQDVSQATSDFDTESLVTSTAPSITSFRTNTVPSTSWEESEIVRTMSRCTSSFSSEYTASTVSTDSRLAQSSPSASLTTWSTPPTTGESNSWLPQIIVASWEDPPKMFRCTFCLKQCIDQGDWERHELFHIPKKIWVCMLSGPDRNHVCAFCDLPKPDSDHLSQRSIKQCFDTKRKCQTFPSKETLQQHLSVIHNQAEMVPRMSKWSRYPKNDEWYWTCGFCERLLPNWTDRVEHLAIHFNDGMVISSWDPLRPPYPLDRTTLTSVTSFPAVKWDMRTLWDLEQRRCNWSWTSQLEDQLSCKSCDASFRTNADVERHENVWHSRRIVWSCPTLDQIESGILEPYFFPVDRCRRSFDNDACPFCNDRFVNIAKSYPDYEDTWDIRLAHLELDHNLNGCDQPCKSTCAATIMLHLANIHNVSFNESTFEVLESCRKEERPLTKRLDLGPN